jgi:hypothetical protein
MQYIFAKTKIPMVVEALTLRNAASENVTGVFQGITAEINAERISRFLLRRRKSRCNGLATCPFTLSPQPRRIEEGTHKKSK